MSTFYELDPSPAASEASELVQRYVFSANLAAQDASQDASTSISASQLLTALRGTIAGRSHVFVLASPDADTLGFIQADLPLASDRSTAVLELLLDAELLPLPDQPVDEEVDEVLRALVAEIPGVMARLDRSVAQVWLRTSPGAPAPWVLRLRELLEEAGFELAHESAQKVIHPQAVQRALSKGMTAQGFNGYRCLPELVPGLLELFTQADQDVDNGSLLHDPQPWTPQRYEEAAQVAEEIGDEVLTVVLMDGDRPVALTEFLQPQGGQKDAVEQTITVVHRDYRGHGVGHAIKQQGLNWAIEHWPGLERVYVDNAAGAMSAINEAHGARTISRSYCMQRSY